MRNDYKMTKETAKLEVQIEKNVINTLQTMAKHTKLTVDEIVNTSIKRFIAGHQDFMPGKHIDE